MQDNYWYELRDKLDDIPAGYDAYRRDRCLEFEGLDDCDFSNYKGAVESLMEGRWDPEDDEEENEEENEEGEDESEETHICPFDIKLLFGGEVHD